MMASCQPQPPIINKHIFVNGGPPSESQSEISSVDSDWSDLRSIAAQLGVANPDDLHTERFKIDRQKLEDMIKTETYSEGMNTAEQFFTTIMKETSTHVSWPCRLKIGAKTKKDPHVRIVGKISDVQKAKDRIMSKLDSRGSRVIMKMDVSYTDHSFIIGRGGNNIKRIMEDTATHIHFPDSNRSNPTEKSNQVSLCGSLEGVEKARSLVRISTPLLISFELPILPATATPPDNETPFVKQVEREYNVQVIFSTRPKLHSSLVLVKGSEKEEIKVKEATKHLMDFLCESLASQIPVQMQLEISTQHHTVVLGRGSSNLREIMARTGTQIMFPDANDVNIKPIKRSQVTITGSINGVYMARQQLLGSLPIALIFDYPENTVDTLQISKLMQAHDVFITVRQKSRQSTLCIVIKGIEKFISNIYEARHQLLKLTSTRVTATIPLSYYGPNDKANKCSQSVQQLFSGAQQPYSPLSPINSLQFPPWISSLNPPPPLPPPDFTMNLNQLHNQFQNFHLPSNKFAHHLLQQQQQQQQQYHHSPQQQHQLHQLTTSNINNFNQLSNNKQTNNLLQVPQQQQQQHMLTQRNLNAATANCMSSNGDIHSSGYQSLNCSSNSLDQQQSSTSSSTVNTSPDTTTTTTTATNNNRQINYNNNNISPRQYAGDVEQRTPRYDHKQKLNDSLVFNFDPRIVAGYKAMHLSPNPNEIRTPTPSWQGLGLSQTSPVPLQTHDLNWSTDGNDSRLNMTTAILEATPVRQREQLSQYNDVTSILTSLGLEHHIKHFINGEIDMTVFPTLTEPDLLNLGVKPLGARRKIMMAVHDMAARQSHPPQAISPSSSSSSISRFSGSAAPGAERRPCQ